jgi:hypothetical protein
MEAVNHILLCRHYALHAFHAFDSIEEPRLQNDVIPSK